MTNSTAPALTATAVEVCLDCLLAAAGYDEHETGSTPTVEPWGLWADEPGHAYAEGTEEGFSSRPCEGCGSHLAGDRFAATWLR
jgi:hypothetical protein